MHAYPLRQGSGAGLPLGLQRKKCALVSPRAIAVRSVQSIVNITGRSRPNQLTSGGRGHAAPFDINLKADRGGVKTARPLEITPHRGAPSPLAIDWSRNSAVGSTWLSASRPEINRFQPSYSG